jgi:response regulator NasT
MTDISDNISGTTILIVDEDSILRLDLRDLLQAMGYLVIGEARDGQSAITMARSLHPDLVIMGVRLVGDMDGVGVAAMLTSERIAPVLLLSHFSDAPLARRAAEAGVAGYVLKPVDEGNLYPAIELAISRFRQIQSLENKIRYLLDELETTKLLERAKGVLMKQHQLTEEEALARIENVCSNSKKSIRVVAEAIILTQRLGA